MQDLPSPGILSSCFGGGSGPNQVDHGEASKTEGVEAPRFRCRCIPSRLYDRTRKFILRGAQTRLRRQASHESHIAESVLQEPRPPHSSSS